MTDQDLIKQLKLSAITSKKNCITLQNENSALKQQISQKNDQIIKLSAEIQQLKQQSLDNQALQQAQESSEVSSLKLQLQALQIENQSLQGLRNQKQAIDNTLLKQINLLKVESSEKDITIGRLQAQLCESAQAPAQASGLESKISQLRRQGCNK